MAWTAPLTAVANTPFSAAQYNLYIRDNFREMAPEKATAAGQYFCSTDQNKLGVYTAQTASVATSQTTTSTSYTDLATVGPSVTIDHGKTVMVILAATMSNNTADLQCRMTFEATGSVITIVPNDKWCAKVDGTPLGQASRVSAARLAGDLHAGTSTFTAKYRVGGGTGTFFDRTIIVWPL